MSYYIATDSTCDLPKDFYQDNFICVPMTYMVDDVEYGIDKELTAKEFYDKERAGSMPSTSLITTYRLKEAFSKILSEGNDLLYLCFSSALSGTYQNAVTATDELRQEFPDRTILLIDTKAPSVAEGLLVKYALDAMNEGKTIQENYDYINSLVDHMNAYFTVDNLFHLQRGGRVSKTTAIAGTLFNIKPILYCNIEGKLIPIAKVKGRKKAISTLLDLFESKTYELTGQKTIAIGHGDCLQDAIDLKAKITERTGIEDIFITDIGPVIGTHSGPNTLAIFFLGKDKVSDKDDTLKKAKK